MGRGVSLDEAYRKWADELTRYATALVGPSGAADLVADTFVVLLARGDARWEDVREPRSYLHRAVLSSALMNARGASRRHRREMRWAGEPFHGEVLSDPAVRAALGQLSVQQRAVTFLTYWQDMSPAMVASWLGISEGSVKRQLARARSRLREVLA